jgi:uncharacterized protein (DUF885 family)
MSTISLVAYAVLLPAAAPADVMPMSSRLHALFDAEWDRTMREDPTWASSLGDLRFNDQWPDQSFEAIERSHQADRQVLAALESIDYDALSPADQLNFRLFKREYGLRVEAHPYGWSLVPLNQRGGIQDAGSLADSLPFQRVRDYEDWLARMRAFPAYMQQTIALMREGVGRGVIHPHVVMERVPAQIEKQIVEDPEEQLFFTPFRSFPDEITDGDRQRLREEAIRLIEQAILPAYREFQTFFNEEYLPACLPAVGVWQLPDGAALYALRCREFTTTELTPDEIHEIGLSEVARIRSEMEQIIVDLKFEGSFDDFLEYLRTDKQFYFDDPGDLLEAYQALCKRIDPQLVRLFKRLPRVPYGVEPIPDYIAPDTTTAYYRPPAADGSRAGTYFVNLYRPEVRPKYEMEALSLHESVPGHHLQIALAQELDGLPEFRRYGGYTAYVEGWALYAESLGEELGLYQDPYSKFGQLTYEMWRAVRLVVDTGIHHLHWDRGRAIEFFAANTAKTRLDIENEIDRYIVWPGQALAYKIGELRIRELRRRAAAELGDAFDIREFHDVVLRQGAIPLDTLEIAVDDWISAQRKTAALDN